MRQSAIIIALIVVMLLLGVANLIWGSLRIPAADAVHILLGGQVEAHPQWTFIIRESRFPQMLTALLCGMSLSTCGLLLQTLFRNPLAGPSILGIDAGANLGVALVMLFLGGTVTLGSLSVSGYLLVIVAAMLGALCIMLLLLLLVWGMGNFSGVSLDRLPLYCILLAIGMIGAVLLVKPLDAILLGERYATNLGVNVHKTRNWLLLCTGLLTATTTAFCGPISFLGLAVPHIARMTLRTSQHRILLPGTMLMGACLTLLCNLLCNVPSSGSIIPVNVLTPLIGAPVILYVILKKH